MNLQKKRGIRIKTRIILAALLFILQIILLQLAILALEEKFIWFYSAAEVISIITVIYIVNKRGNPSYKITWIIFILALPVFGLFVYLFWGGERMFPHLKRRMAKLSERYMRCLPENKNLDELLSFENSSMSRQAAFLKKESGFPVYTDTVCEYLSPGEVFFPKLLEELKKAKHYIFLEYFIIAEGEMWNKIEEILTEKSAAGVEVKIIFDDFGSIKRQYKDFVTRLAKKGIEVSVFNPIKPSFNIFMNNRNHRKIAIIDGNVAFTGGINIADEYINKFKRFGYWLDSAIMIKGKAVDSFVVMFCTMWEYNTGKGIKLSKHILSQKEENDSYTLPYCDGPMDQKSAAQGIYTQILNTAHRYVYIATPYLILDNNMISAITLAAKSGVDVRIATPFIPDKKYVHPVTQYYYQELLEAGVRIYEYTPGFIHSKLFVSDDNTATVGTVNMDYRSFVFHFECGVWLTDKPTVAEIKADLLNVFDKSKEITLTAWKRRGVINRLKQWCLHIFAPFM